MTPPPPLAAVVAVLGVFGLMVGSFLNVCIFRIPLGQSIVYAAVALHAVRPARSRW